MWSRSIVDTKYAASRSTQIAARRPHSSSCVRTRNHIYVHTHAARKWNCGELYCAITEKVEICSTCGLPPAAKYEPAFSIERLVGKYLWMERYLYLRKGLKQYSYTRNLVCVQSVFNTLQPGASLSWVKGLRGTSIGALAYQILEERNYIEPEFKNILENI